MRSPIFKKLPSCLLGAVIAACMATSVTVRAVDGNPPGLFELEGNVAGSAAPGDDWEDLYAGGANTGANSFAFTEIVHDVGPTDRVYTQGGSKDVNDVNQWKYTTGSTPDKNEITNAYAAAYNVPADVCENASGAPVLCSAPGAIPGPIHKAGDMIVYFGLDRFANDGTAFAGFWFFQGDVGLTDPNNQGGGDFTGNHVAMRLNPDWQAGDPIAQKFLPGDMFVVIEYPSGANAQPTIKVFQWDPSDVDADKNWDPSVSANPPKNLQGPLDLVIAKTNARCGDNTVPPDGTIESKLACAITNAAALSPPAGSPAGTQVPSWDYTPKTGPIDSIPLESFFEGGLNVTQLLGSTPCFASFLASTRSSISATAQLKDFVFGAFPVCGIDVAKDCTADLNEAGDGVEVSFTGTLENTGGSSYFAYLKDDQAGATIDDVCIDTGAPGCADDGPLAGLQLQSDGSAYFPLPAKATVRYEGSYSVDSLPTTLTMTDEVTALAFNDVDDVPGPNEDPVLAKVVVDDSDVAECSFNVNADLTVVKNCSVAFLNGNSADVTISGTVKNTGDVALSNVTLVDSDFGSVTFPTTLAVDEIQSFSKTVSVPYANLAPTASAPDANGVVTVTLNHSDTVTASGDALAGTTVLDSDESSDDAACSDTFTRGVDVAKDCDVALDYDAVANRIVIRVDVSATVTNTGEETLNNIVLTDDPAVTFTGVDTSLATGEDFTATGSYFPSTTDGGDVGTGPEASFTDEVTVTAQGAFDAVQATDSDDATCDLCF